MLNALFTLFCVGDSHSKSVSAVIATLCLEESTPTLSPALRRFCSLFRDVSRSGGGEGVCFDIDVPFMDERSIAFFLTLTTYESCNNS